MKRARHETRLALNSILTSEESSERWNSVGESPEWTHCINTIARLMSKPRSDSSSPNAKAKRQTLGFLKDARRSGKLPPLMIDLEPTGGIIVTFEEDNKSDEWTFYNSGEIEFTKYIDNKVVHLQLVESPATNCSDATMAFLGWEQDDLISPFRVSRAHVIKHLEPQSEDDLVYSW